MRLNIQALDFRRDWRSDCIFPDASEIAYCERRGQSVPRWKSRERLVANNLLTLTCSLLKSYTFFFPFFEEATATGYTCKVWDEREEKCYIHFWRSGEKTVIWRKRDCRVRKRKEKKKRVCCLFYRPLEKWKHEDCVTFKFSRISSGDKVCELTLLYEYCEARGEDEVHSMLVSVSRTHGDRWMEIRKQRQRKG